MNGISQNVDAQFLGNLYWNQLWYNLLCSTPDLKGGLNSTGFWL